MVIVVELTWEVFCFSAVVRPLTTFFSLLISTS